MARFIGPKTKVARKFGEAIYGPDKVFEKKNYPRDNMALTAVKRHLSMVLS